MRELEAGRVLELVAQEVRHGARCRRRVGRLVGVGLEPVGQLGQRLDGGRHHGADAEAAGGQGQRRDRDDVGRRVVGQLLVGVRVDGEHGRRTEQQRLAVGRGVLQAGDGDAAAGAHLLLDEHGLGQLAASELGEATRRGVYRAAGREADEDARRLTLGAGRERQGGE